MTLLELKIVNSGAAFDTMPREELARVLRVLAASIECHSNPSRVSDINGNPCAFVTFNLSAIRSLEQTGA